MIAGTHAAAARAPRELLIVVLAVIGGAGVVAGATLPWLTVYHGLDSYSGIAATNGRLLAAGGAAAALVGLCYGRRGSSRFRYLIGALGFVLALFTAYLVSELLAVYKQLHGVYLPALGPGVFVAGAGALLLVSTLFVATVPSVRMHRLDPTTAMLASLSAAAGCVHLTVAADHFAEYFLFGLFFVVVGTAQVAWAAAVTLAGASRVLLLVSIGNVLVVVLWLASRTTGLPLGPSPGVPEPFGFADTLTSLFEAVLVACAAMLLLGRGARVRTPGALWAMPLLIAAASVVAALSAVGAIALP